MDGTDLDAVPLGNRHEGIPDPREHVFSEMVGQPSGDQKAGIHPVSEPVTRRPLDAVNIQEESCCLNVSSIVQEPGRLPEHRFLYGKRRLFA
ncbi:hypothetical protein [Streptomyces longwoodensis]|uniref:hypothetical protein n=1 Tax=Streptomyces longwoodensis TaxID=68231 RepID=UPI0038517D61